MSTFIRPGERASPERLRNRRNNRRNKGGFTLPEILISLLLCSLLMQSLAQWNSLSVQTHKRMNENQQALLIAQSVMAGSRVSLPDGWDVEIVKQPLGLSITEQELTVTYEDETSTQCWSFYYAGP